MGTQRKTRRNTAGPAVDPARSHHTSTIDPRLPHERDETTDSKAPATRAVIRQGHNDLASGQKDTDCRNAAANIIARKSTRPARAKRKP
jgi:hypothetical protein